MPCNTLISDTDIAQVYHIGKIERVSIDSRCIDNNTKEAFIEPQHASGPAFVCKKIHRRYFRNKQLLGLNGRGKVAKHELFFMCSYYRGKKIASQLADNEMQIYKQNNFDEIQLDAAADGVVVWSRLGFNYARKRDEALLLNAWRKYFAEVYQNDELSNQEKLSIIAKTKKLSDIKGKHLKPKTGQSFTEWLLSIRYMLLLPMYKRVA